MPVHSVQEARGQGGVRWRVRRQALAAIAWGALSVLMPMAAAAEPVAVRFVVDGEAALMRLADTPTARDFLAMLPLTLVFEDYHGTEKISDLPARLSAAGSPAGFDPDVGTVAYFAPWGNLAVFYRDFGYSNGLVELGTVVSGLEVLKRNESFTATVERVE